MSLKTDCRQRGPETFFWYLFTYTAYAELKVHYGILVLILSYHLGDQRAHTCHHSRYGAFFV
jgi:hypothetical protein